MLEVYDYIDKANITLFGKVLVVVYYFNILSYLAPIAVR